MSLRCSRRQLFGIAGAVAAGSTLAACGSPSGSAQARRTTGDLAHFRSRPDIEPPLVEVAGDFEAAGGASAGYIFASPAGPMIFDARGEPIWYRPARHAAAMDLQVQRYHGEPVLTWWQGSIRYGVGHVGEVHVLDSHYREVTRVTAANGLRTDLHEFVIAPDGTGYLTAYQVITADLTAVGGPSRAKMLEGWIQGIDLATGALVFEWRSSDHIPLTETYRKYTSPKTPFTPVHLNSIDVLSDGNLLVSARHTWTIYKIDRATGKILWRLGGKESDFVLGPGVHFAWQHDAEWHPGNVLTIFDNESAPPEAKQSAGLVLQVTETNMTATLLHAYHFPGEFLLCGSQGSVQLLPDGDVFMGWGSEPYFTQYRHDGKAILRGRFKKYTSYRAYRVPWTGTPAEPPAIAVERRGGNDVRVYASWNGATEVARWSVLAGRSHDALSPVRTTARTGFETAIDVTAPKGARVVAVRAIDGSGKTLATSAPTKI